MTTEPVSLIIVNARVWTGDPRRPWADAVAVRGDSVAAIGSSAEVKKLATRATRVIDARGQMLVPGIHDPDADVSGGAHAPLAGRGSGSIERGKPADLTLVDRDVTRVAPEGSGGARVTMTIAAGRVAWERAAGR